MTKARDLANIISGGFTADDIPNLPASKITSGDIDAARLSNAPSETKPTVSSATPNVISNDAENVVLAGTNFISIPRVSAINTATGIWYEANSVTFTSSTSITANFTLPVDGNTYRIRIENPDGLSVISGSNFLTVSDVPTFTTSTGSLGSSGNGEAFSFTVAATGDTPISYSKVSGSFPGGGSIDSSTGVISGTETGSTATTEYSFTIRATDAQSQTVDRAFTITITHGASGGAQFN